MTQLHKATLIGSVSVFLWGTLALLTRMTGGAIPEFQMMTMTFAIAFLLMLIRWHGQKRSGLRYLRQPLAAWVIGVAGLFGYHFVYFKAMTLAPAVEVSLLAYLWPLLIVIFSALLPGERLRGVHLLGACLALLGCWILIGQNHNGFQPQYLPGYLLALLCALIWSSYSVLSRLVKSVPTDAVGWFCAVTAVLALVCHLVLEETVWPQSWAEWVGVIGLGLGPVGIAFFYLGLWRQARQSAVAGHPGLQCATDLGGAIGAGGRGECQLDAVLCQYRYCEWFVYCREAAETGGLKRPQSERLQEVSWLALCG
ncbi:DMT family transporter [Nitrincola sp. A-D6]|uniref:DMT family transporter n=1 Tax=Nitrincola sp. A-D6 TaxID=1545442 RepID=UPI000B15E891|nr:DMT family transporter [Nitrincola sp. A-D6]